jgi:ADP-ribose pyrophosphatase YjhB (NUDIX family)
LAHREDPDEGARRILREQVGLADAAPRLSHVESFVGGPQDAWHLIFHYLAELPGAAVPPEPGENVREATWFGLDELPQPPEVAHGGWALEILDEIAARRA